MFGMEKNAAWNICQKWMNNPAQLANSFEGYNLDKIPPKLIKHLEAHYGPNRPEGFNPENIMKKSRAAGHFVEIGQLMYDYVMMSEGVGEQLDEKRKTMQSAGAMSQARPQTTEHAALATGGDGRADMIVVIEFCQNKKESGWHSRVDDTKYYQYA